MELNTFLNIRIAFEFQVMMNDVKERREGYVQGGIESYWMESYWLQRPKVPGRLALTTQSIALQTYQRRKEPATDSTFVKS